MSEDYQLPSLGLREQDLASNVAVVSGASKGIGRATVLQLASRGCSVLATCSTSESLQLITTLGEEVKALHRGSDHPQKAPEVVGVVADIFSPDCHITIADAVEKQFGYLNIIVLNAGARAGGGVGSMEVENVQRYCLGGIQAPVMTVDELVKRKLFRKNSRVVYISSGRSKKPTPGAPLYCATKSAMESYVRCWADAFGGKDPQFGFMAGTTANSLQVGLTKTEAVTRHGPEALEKFKQEFMPQMSIPRVAECEDVADVVGLLVGRDARWITGSVVAADGGTIKVC